MKNNDEFYCGNDKKMKRLPSHLSLPDWCKNAIPFLKSGSDKLKNENESLRETVTKLTRKNDDLNRQIAVLRDKCKELEESQKKDVNSEKLLEDNHAQLLDHLQYLLGFPVNVEKYGNKEFLEILLQALTFTVGCLQAEGLEIENQVTENNRANFVEQTDSSIEEERITRPLVLRNGRVVLKGVINVPIKTTKE